MSSHSRSEAGEPTAPGRFVPGGLYDLATRWEGLWAGWEKVRANMGAAGGDGMTVEVFARGAEARVSQLAHRLRIGRYLPGPVRRVHIPKKGGGLRPLDIPSVVDRVAQAAVATVLTPVLDDAFEDSSFAYRPGRSVAAAVRRVAALRRDGFRHVVDGDIVRYFERIPHPALIDRLEAHVDDTALVDLIGVWLEHHAPGERGVPQGSPISPLLANLYLDAVDEAIARRGVRLVRYADDFLLLCRSEALAEGALADVRELLAAHGLELNPDKTRIVDFDRGFRFLGHVFVRGMVWKETIVDDDTPDEDAVAAAERAAAVAAPAEPPPWDEAPAGAQRGRWAARQRLLYVLEPGRVLTSDGDAFVVREAGEDGPVLKRLPTHRVDRIEVSTAADIDVRALDLAAASDVDVLRIDGFGRALGRWQGNGGARAARQLAQAALVLDGARRVETARAIVGTRIRNQRVQLKRMARARPAADIADVAQKLDRLVRSAERKPDLGIADLTGLEGAAGALYWPAAAGLVGEPGLFAGRRRRDATVDPAILLLDVLSGLLLRDVSTAVERAGLHAGFGVLHGTEDGATALAYDLAEAFRAPIAEACAFAMIGRKVVTAADFAPPDRLFRMPAAVHATAIRQYEAWVGRPIRSRRSGETVLWRGLFDEEAEAFAAAVETGAPFEPYRMDY